MTLLEVVVAMAISSVLLAIFTTGFVGMHWVVNRNEAVSTAQSQINLMLLRLDKEVRYAEGISRDGRVGDDWYVEYRVRNMNTRVIECVGLRLRPAAGRLERRAWVPGALSADNAWIPLADGVGPRAGLPPGESPMRRQDATETSPFQRLWLRLEAVPRDRAPASAKQTDIKFTALNTSLVTSSDTVCAEGRPT